MIGVFDSGFGGLTILKEFLRALPEYNYIYLGDNARAPYGNKSQDVIYEHTRAAVDFLFKNGCELVVIACNSASAKALRKIQKEYLINNYPDKRVLGVIIPVVEVVASYKNINRVGIIGTRATITSKTYEDELKKLNFNENIYKQATPLLVPIIEEGRAKSLETKKILKKYLQPLKDKKIDLLVLGCTHYPILTKEVKQIVSKRTQVLDSPKIVANKLVDYLNRHSVTEKKLKKNKKLLFYTTDNEKRFKEMGEKFLEKEIKKVKKIEL